MGLTAGGGIVSRTWDCQQDVGLVAVHGIVSRTLECQQYMGLSAGRWNVSRRRDCQQGMVLPAGRRTVSKTWDFQQEVRLTAGRGTVSRTRGNPSGLAVKPAGIMTTVNRTRITTLSIGLLTQSAVKKGIDAASKTCDTVRQ